MIRKALLVCCGLLFVTSTTAWAGAEIWDPPAGLTWHWQLQGELDMDVDVDVYNVDLFDTSKDQVHTLHERGVEVICYVSAGSWENWRPDADDFPARVLGRKLDGWAGERWLDIRRLADLKPIMRLRMERCAEKGFDGVEFDNVDGYRNNTGFNLTGADQLRYNKFLARAARDVGLAPGLKNDLGQIDDLEDHFAFAVNEQCFQYHECGALKPFIGAGKPVFHVEYELETSEFCPRARDLGFSSMRKRYSLRAWSDPCW
jgi:hypothetical protein